MSEDNDLPAFPSTIRNGGDVVVHGFLGEEINPGMENHYSGMSLRDYFAAKALQALASRSPTLLEPSRWAEHAYQVADLMIEERAK